MAEETTHQITEEAQTQETTEESTQTTETTETEKGTLAGDAGKAEASNAPEAYEFKLPEGMELDATLTDKVTPVFKELDLTQENAQKLVDVYSPYVQEQVKVQEKAAIDSWNKQVDEWKTETVKQLGTTAKEDMVAVGKILNVAGTPELRKILNESGYGNHPEFVKFFVKVGKAVSEDSFIEGKSDTAGEGGINLDKMYPSMQEK